MQAHHTYVTWECTAPAHVVYGLGICLVTLCHVEAAEGDTECTARLGTLPIAALVHAEVEEVGGDDRDRLRGGTHNAQQRKKRHRVWRSWGCLRANAAVHCCTRHCANNAGRAAVVQVLDTTGHAVNDSTTLDEGE